MAARIEKQTLLTTSIAIFLLLALTTTYSKADESDLITKTEKTEKETEREIEIEKEMEMSLGRASYESQSGAPLDSINELQCEEGLVIPLWLPIKNVSLPERLARGLVYFLSLCYLFTGVSIVSDRFMSSIETITSTERKITIKNKHGEKEVISVRIWNETVANLTLMALGSSAPEILLSVIEIYAKNFEAGDLGPGTIIGSAAFNLFVIIAVCILVIPKGEVRRIKHLRVFTVTAFFSVFAYIWLYIILAVTSPGRVQVWEGVVTFMFFAVVVLVAYIADRRLLIYKYLDKNYRMNKSGVIVSGERESSLEMDGRDPEKGRGSLRKYSDDDLDATEIEETRREYLELLDDFRKKYPDSSQEQLEAMVHDQMVTRGSKSRAFYRVQATRRMIGSGNVLRKPQLRTHADDIREQKRARPEIEDISAPIQVFFDPVHYTVMESCGEFEVRVARRGDLSIYTTVEFETENGSAEAGTDFVGKKGTVVFPPGVDEQRFKIEVIDDDIFEEDETFFIRLSNPSEPAVLVTPKVATVTILDDDHAGIFSLEEPEKTVPESCGRCEVDVVRYSGARGRVFLNFWTEDGTAKAGRDFEPLRGEIEFDNNETRKTIFIPIVEQSSYEKDVTLHVYIAEPIMAADSTENFKLIREAESKPPEDLTSHDKIILKGRPKLGAVTHTEIRITESTEFRKTIDRLVKKTNAAELIGTSSWTEQFREALTVLPGNDEFNDGDEVEEVPSCVDYILHFVTLFWKVIFAFIPPTEILGGYPCFIISIVLIGMLTAVIGDVASYFGCTLGIKDVVTATTFVALGTSIPDTFASKIAAVNDKYADASIGNVTGSNAVNVFLGIGVAWTIAAVYHEINGTTFEVNPGSIGFSVMLFCGEAVIAITLLVIKRSQKYGGGELGGPPGPRYFVAGCFFTLWLIYITLSSLEAYGIVQGF